MTPAYVPKVGDCPICRKRVMCLDGFVPQHGYSVVDGKRVNKCRGSGRLADNVKPLNNGG
jgi:hypothetical protein